MRLQWRTINTTATVKEPPLIAGVPAFGMDIDAAALVNMTHACQPVGPKNSDELKYIKHSTSIPFIVKGIMTVDEAEICYQAGVDGIVVSNYGGRALDLYTRHGGGITPYCYGGQREAVIFVEGGIQTGGDILKMLALGADAVLGGRFLAVAAVGRRTWRRNYGSQSFGW